MCVLSMYEGQNESVGASSPFLPCESQGEGSACQAWP